MVDKLLVTYGTWAGSTGEVAEAIAEVLRNEETEVDVYQARYVTDLGAYRGAVVGTAIHAGRVHPEMRQFVVKHETALSKMPVAYFVVCMTMQKDTEETRCEANAYLDQVRKAAPKVEPVDVGLFGGVIEYAKLPILMKLMLKVMKSSEGDARDWDGIRAWAEGLRPTLVQA